MSRWLVPFVMTACLLFASEARAGHGKVDSLVLDNGNQFTCELLNLKRGKASAKVDGMGTVSVEWEHVRRVTSPAIFEVELTSGRFLFGSLSSPTDGRLLVHSTVRDDAVEMLDVVRLAAIEAGFWNRLDGSVDFGFSFSQADSLTQWTFNSMIERRTPRYLNRITLTSQETIDEEENRQSRNSATYQVQRFLGSRWFFSPAVQFSQNEQLGLDFRSVVSGAAGRYLQQSNKTILTLLGGVTYTAEQFSGEDATNRSEAVGGIRWDLFTFGDHETDVVSSLQVYENIGEERRTRLEATVTFRQKFYKDFYWAVNVYESFDSHPPEAQRKNDSSVAITLGWTF